MSAVVGARDSLLLGTVPRLVPVLGPGNVTVPTTAIVGLPDYYSAAKQLALRAPTQVFKTLTVGGITPASIVITADLNNIIGTVTWSVVSGSVSYTTGATTLTINSGGLTSNTAVIQATVTYNSITYTDQITIINAVEGSGLVLGFLSNSNAIVPTLGSTTVLSYDRSGGTFSVYEGIVDRTGTAVTYSVVSNTGVNVALATTGVYTVSGLTADNGGATLRAVYGGTTIDKPYTVSKEVVQGASGPRGNVNLSRGIVGSSWSDAEAVLAISSQGFGVPADRDVVTLFNNSTGYSESKFFLTGAWYALTAYINGNLLVTGTVAANALAVDSVTADKIQAGSITAGKIAATSITADRMNVTQLSAITATIGTFRTATSGARTEISDNVIKVYNTAGNLKVKIGNLDG